MEYTIIGAIATGSTLFGYVLGAWLRSRKDSEPEILSKNDLRQLGLHGTESSVSRIFTVKKKKRMAVAEQLHNIAKSSIQTDEQKLADMETKIQELKKEIMREAGKMKTQKTKMELDAHIKGSIKHRYQKMRNLQMKISQQGNMYENHLSEERFWNGVLNGDKRARTMNNLLHFDESLQEHNDKTDKILKRLQKDIALDDEIFDELTTYIMNEM